MAGAIVADRHHGGQWRPALYPDAVLSASACFSQNCMSNWLCPCLGIGMSFASRIGKVIVPCSEGELGHVISFSMTTWHGFFPEVIAEIVPEQEGAPRYTHGGESLNEDRPKKPSVLECAGVCLS